jgi:hypothetical protein
MIYHFFDITYEITPEEVLEAELLADKWNKDPYKHEHKCAGQLCDSFARAGIHMSEVRLRKIINFIRLNNMITGLCSDSKGYWIARNANELKDTLISLKDRLLMQSATYKVLLNQYKRMKDKEEDPPNPLPSKEELF